MGDDLPVLVVATRNRGKFSEFQVLLSDLRVRLLSLLDFPHIDLIPEEGDTYAANAEAKALAVARATGHVALADDSGLEVEALGGLPGVRSARFLGETATDAQRNAEMLVRLRDVPVDRRTARFRAVVAVAHPNGTVRTFEGSVEGRIAERAAGTQGFGYDPIFLLPELGRTMAELGPQEKNRISHRARAAAGAKVYLVAIFP